MGVNDINVIKQVAALTEMPIADLKKKWVDLHPKTTPPPFNRMFLVKRLAHRIQELSLGGLPEQEKNRMKRLLTDEPALPIPKKLMGDRLLPGTRLIREWKGQECCCTVLEDGFEYQGRKFGSLSAVANFISGTKWNGLTFWGLKKQEIRACSQSNQPDECAYEIKK
ncbi:MAG: DUF2924 domain-containing protein [Magnetococcales bacterium]|nr:DUF2924 domain-containing protein [Magnetococcales bacterium]